MDNHEKKILKAFTFVELSVVVVIVSILAFVIFGSSESVFFSSSITKARALTANSPVTKINGLVAWYETTLPESLIASEAIDGGQITRWRDINPASIVMQRNVLERTADSTVRYVRNGIGDLPSVRFVGQGTTASDTKIATEAGFAQGTFSNTTIFVVFSSATAYSTYIRVLTDSGPAGSSNGNMVRTGATQTSVYLAQGGTGLASTPATFSANSNYILAAYLNGSQARAYVNNVNTSTTAANVGVGVFNGITVGARYDGAYRCDCSISEVIIYNRPLNVDERKAVMGYLSKKYKISVNGL